MFLDKGRRQGGPRVSRTEYLSCTGSSSSSNRPGFRNTLGTGTIPTVQVGKLRLKGVNDLSRVTQLWVKELGVKTSFIPKPSQMGDFS